MKANSSTLIKEKLFEKYGDIFKFINQICNVFDRSPNLDCLEKAIVLFHYTRAVRLLQGISILCAAGSGTEACVLLRSLLNLSINIDWLVQKDTEYRMNRFADFEVIYKKIGVENLKSHRGYKMENENSEHLEKAYEIVKSRYSLKKRSDFFNWSGKSIWGMADDLNRLKDYDIAYNHLSNIEHSSPSSVRDYLDDYREDVVKILADPSEMNVLIALITSPQYFLQVKRIAYETFEMPIKEVDENYTILRELDQKYGNL